MSKNNSKEQLQKTLQSSKNSQYWRKRFETNQKNIFKPTDDYILEVEDIFKSASKEIEKEILVWYQRFSENNNIIDISEAKKRLNKKELSELKWDVFEYIKHGEENGISANWAKELENASARYHISRLESLELQCRQHIENLYSGYYKKTDTLISNTYAESMYRSAFEIAKGTSIGSNFAVIDENKLKKIISKPWSADGKNFSERIWGEHRVKLINTLHKQLSNGVLTGKSADKIVDEVVKTMKTSRFNAIRLVMTESAYFASLGQRDCFKKLGVEKYQILGTLDGHTCSDCGSLDGQIFDIDIFEAGVTAPPFHPFCRCTTIPYFNDEFSQGEQRFARDKDGNVIYVDADITYEDWKENFLKNAVEKHNKNDIIKLTECEKRALNYYISSDSYKINEKLRNDIKLSDNDKEFIKNLDSALNKMSNYDDTLVRVLYFDNLEKRKEFIDTFEIDKTRTFKEYLSTSSIEGYNPAGNVKIYIDKSKTGKDIREFNIKEQEILFQRNSKFKVIDKQEKEGIVYIILEEG